MSGQGRQVIGNDTGKGEPVVTGDLFLEMYRYSLIGFGFNSVQSAPNAYSSAPDSIYYWIAKTSEYSAASPLITTTWDAKATILYKMDKYDDAITAVNKAVDINPSEDFNCQIKGTILRLQGKNIDADAALTKAKIWGTG